MRWLRERYAALGNVGQGVLIYLLTLVIAGALMGILLGSSLGHSALTYVGVPWLVSLMVVLLLQKGRFDSIWLSFFIFGFYLVTILLLVSILTSEGFICVLFFIPIYLMIGFVMFLVYALVQIVGAVHRRWLKRFQTVVFPAVVLVLSMEGTHEALTFDRWNHVYAETETHLTEAELLRNLNQPIDLNKDRGWLLGIFPMPYEIETSDLSPGAVHVVRMRYHRWFVTNTHEGEVHLLIKTVSPDEVTTEVLFDSSYVSTYLSLTGTSIRFDEIEGGRLRVSLAMTYRRNLDPAWYFQPIQRFAVKQFADFLLREVVVR
ncbi:MAG: hypothetical protein AAF525_20460 [Pseudomonadota bacterium]